MINEQIEQLIFEARSLDDDIPIRMRFLEITRIDTTEDRFEYDAGIGQPVTCRYSSLRQLSPEEVFELSLELSLHDIAA